MPPLHLITPTDRIRITTLDPKDLTIGETLVRRQYDTFHVQYAADCTIISGGGITRGTHIILDGHLSKQDAFFERNRLTPRARITLYALRGQRYWRVETPWEIRDMIPTETQAIQLGCEP